jgi:hypothetical protein
VTVTINLRMLLSFRVSATGQGGGLQHPRDSSREHSFALVSPQQRNGLFIQRDQGFDLRCLDFPEPAGATGET